MSTPAPAACVDGDDRPRKPNLGDTVSPRIQPPLTTSRAPRRLALLLATVLLLAIPAMALAGHFTDVPAGHTHEEGIDYLEDTGITLGCTPTQFCPNDNLTRAQMGTFLYRSSGHDPATDPSVNAASLADVHQETNASDVFGSAVNTASVTCPAGMLATGGGSQTTSPASWLQAFSRPLDDSTGWTARYVQKDGFLGINTTTVWVQCVAVGGL